MKIICSWCKKVLGEKEPFDDHSVSHAKCTDCLEKQLEESRKTSANKSENWRHKESPAEIAANVHQVISALVEGALALARKRFGDDLEGLRKKKRSSKNPSAPKS